MSKDAAQRQAIDKAVEELKPVELAARCRSLGIAAPENGVIRMRAFAVDYLISTDSFEITVERTGDPAKDSDCILLLHFLLCEIPLSPSQELIAFRDFPGGMFYLEPFLSRSVRPLVKRYGNRIDELATAFDRFDHERLELGDLSARFHIVGCIYVTLLYRMGDDEFPTEAEIFFNLPAKRAFCAEDAAVLAGRICFGLF